MRSCLKLFIGVIILFLVIGSGNQLSMGGLISNNVLNPLYETDLHFKAVDFSFNPITNRVYAITEDGSGDIS